MADAVSDEELVASGRVPAPLVNKFYVSAGEATIRIAFGEQMKPGVTDMRSAVVMTRTDALALASLLQMLAEGINAPVPGMKAN